MTDWTRLIPDDPTPEGVRVIQTMCPDCGPMYCTSGGPQVAEMAEIDCESCGAVVPIRDVTPYTAGEFYASRLFAAFQPSCTSQHLIEEREAWVRGDLPPK